MGRFSRRQTGDIFPRKQDLTRQTNYLPPKETICMRFKILSSMKKKPKKNNKLFKVLSAEIFTQHAKVLNTFAQY